MLPKIITPSSVTVLFPTGPKTVTESHLNYHLIRQSLSSLPANELESLFDIKAAIVKWAKDTYRITDDAVYEGNTRLPQCLERRVLDFLQEGLPFEPLLAFHKRLKANPSRRAMEELYRFLEHRNIPIDDEGYFYAYKSVRSDWTDHHTEKCINTIGTTLTMPRNEVDDDCNRTCSYGYHAGSLQYASGFGGSNSRLLIVKIDPADVVSIPSDCNGQKLRTCKYQVVAEYTGPLPETHYSTSIDQQMHDDFEEDDTFCPYCGDLKASFNDMCADCYEAGC